MCVREGVACVLTLCTLWQLVHGSERWQDDLLPITYYKLGEYYSQTFEGNTSSTDYFKLLVPHGESIIVGARNVVYNISLEDLEEKERIEWHSSLEGHNMCTMKGRSPEECQNYIRVLHPIDHGKLYVCGTNAYSPMCRIYHHENGDYTLARELTGQGRSPYDPYHNSTAIFDDGKLYVATVADFSGSNPLIFRDPLRTEPYNLQFFNAPNFVSSIAEGDFVYFFLRETAVEYINCGKVVYSRVARVCKKDQGGPSRRGPAQTQWTSFLKARLNCSVPGEFPFHFNDIQSTTELVYGEYGGEVSKVIYGVFTTPNNAITGSAVCAFSLRAIQNAFEGPFKSQESSNSNWLPVSSLKVPQPRPGRCSNNSTSLPDQTLSFIKTHPLMDEAVPEFFGHPIVIRTTYRYRLTHIAVDPQVRTPEGKKYDVLFIGTNTGKVIKALNADSFDSRTTVNPAVIEELEVFPPNESVVNIKVIRTEPSASAKVIVASATRVKAIEVHRCGLKNIRTCSECVRLRDPYCGWDQREKRCVFISRPHWAEPQRYTQDVRSGVSPQCPEGVPQSSTHPEHHPSTTKNDYQSGTLGTPRSNNPRVNTAGPVTHSRNTSGLYPVETLAVAVSAGSVFALLLGFVIGYLFGKRCQKDAYDAPCVDAEYEFLEQRPNLPQQPNRLGGEPVLYTSGGPGGEPIYTAPITPGNKPINLVLNMHSPKNGTQPKSIHSTADRRLHHSGTLSGHGSTTRKMYL